MARGSSEDRVIDIMMMTIHHQVILRIVIHDLGAAIDQSGPIDPIKMMFDITVMSNNTAMIVETIMINDTAMFDTTMMIAILTIRPFLGTSMLFTCLWTNTRGCFMSLSQMRIKRNPVPASIPWDQHAFHMFMDKYKRLFYVTFSDEDQEKPGPRFLHFMREVKCCYDKYYRTPHVMRHKLRLLQYDLCQIIGKVESPSTRPSYMTYQSYKPLSLVRDLRKSRKKIT